MTFFFLRNFGLGRIAWHIIQFFILQDRLDFTNINLGACLVVDHKQNWYRLSENVKRILQKLLNNLWTDKFIWSIVESIGNYIDKIIVTFTGLSDTDQNRFRFQNDISDHFFLKPFRLNVTYLSLRYLFELLLHHSKFKI